MFAKNRKKFLTSVGGDPDKVERDSSRLTGSLLSGGGGAENQCPSGEREPPTFGVGTRGGGSYRKET